MQAGTIETSEDIAEGLAALVQLDPRLAEVVEKAGPVPLRRRTPGFEGLAQVIVSQMVSKAAAAAIERAAESLRDLRIAEVTKLDMQIRDGRVESYRAKVNVSFKYEDSD